MRVAAISRALTAAVVLIGALFAVPAVAEKGALAGETATAWTGIDEAQVRLVAAVTGVGTAESVRLGLQFRMKKDWKISWRSPGDAGLPPVFDWTGSENLSAATVSWPVPVRFSVLIFEVLGYKNEVVLPIVARLAEPGRATRLRLKLDYLVCEDLCIPVQVDLALDLAAGPAAPSEFAHLIDRYAATVPGSGEAQGLSIESAVADGGGEDLTLTIVARSALPFTAPGVFVEGPEEFRFGTPEVEIGEGGQRAELRVPVTGVVGPLGSLAGKPVTLTLVDNGRAMEREITVAAGTITAPRPKSAAAVPFWELAGILLIAFIGGVILNLMPCVLPILSIKLLSLVGHGGRAHGHVRLSFLASSAGILFSFLVLASAAVGLKLAGVAVGWGIQFQQPAFLTAMVLIITLFASNMWGLFEIRLPGWLSAVAVRQVGSRGLGGDFVSGAFATVLATPCTAPFLGTALGFALSRDAFEIFAVFTALGLGFALPYLIVAAAPAIATRLPRPGQWMVTLTRVLGFALAGTAVWLVTVFGAQVSPAAAYALAALMAGVVGALWLAHRDGQVVHAAGVAAVVVLGVLAFAVPVRFPADASAPESALPDKVWQAFDPAQIRRLVASGRVVLVDVTADWCLTCKVNKALVLERGEVARRLAAGEVVAMRADWTKPDDDIAAYLASFGRYGIPFNAVYGPGAPDGIALPELLTEDAVLDAFERAATAGGGAGPEVTGGAGTGEAPGDAGGGEAPASPEG